MVEGETGWCLFKSWLYELQSIFPTYIMDMGSLLGTRLGNILSYKGDPVCDPLTVS